MELLKIILYVYNLYMKDDLFLFNTVISFSEATFEKQLDSLVFLQNIALEANTKNEMDTVRDTILSYRNCLPSDLDQVINGNQVEQASLGILIYINQRLNGQSHDYSQKYLSPEITSIIKK